MARARVSDNGMFPEGRLSSEVSLPDNDISQSVVNSNISLEKKCPRSMSLESPTDAMQSE